MVKRREFIKQTSMTSVGVGLGLGLPAASYKRIMGANDRVNLCFMGLGRRVGGYYPCLLPEFNTRLQYLCDVKQSQVDHAFGELEKRIDYKPQQEQDIRKVLDDQEVNAVFIATPDHWHAPAACMAMDAGKHVFVEKPCAHNPRESEIMVARQQRTGKVVQMGNQQRSSAHTIEIISRIHEGVIGRPYKAIAFYSNQRGRVPVPVPQAPPADLNWDLFQGPAPRQQYHHNTWDYNWHWYGWTWGTAETGNNAVHELDIARWALQVDYPEHVSVEASKEHFVDDGWEMYDTMYATFSFADGKQIMWDGKSRNNYQIYGAGRGTIIFGTEGSVFVNREHYRLHDRTGKVVEESDRTNELGTALGGGGDSTTAHIANFLDAIRGKGQLNAPISDGAVSNHLALLANIAYRVDDAFDVDSATGRAYHKQAMALWGRQYEKGWELA